MNSSFKSAEKAGFWSGVLFWLVMVMSVGLMVFPDIEPWLQPLLILASIAGVLIGIIGGLAQNRGNRLLRASQLSDALGSGIGDPLRQDYYNSPLLPGIPRLASTTLENTLFTQRILEKMVTKERWSTFFYVAVFIVLLAWRKSSLSVVGFVAQTVFSADVILSWWQMERYRIRASQVHEQLRQFFVQGGDATKPNATAIVLAAFTDYECAKDEASFPLSSSVFKAINPAVSAEWEKIKATIKLT